MKLRDLDAMSVLVVLWSTRMPLVTLGSLVVLLVLLPIPVAAFVAIFSDRKHRHAVVILRLYIRALTEIVRRKQTPQ